MGLVKDRLKVLRKVDISVLKFNERNAQRESLVVWGKGGDGELRKDTTEYPKVSPFKSLTAFIP